MSFEEEQRFKQRWLWAMLIVLAASGFSIFGYGLIEQLVFKRPWGDRPVSDGVLVLVSIGVVLFVSLMLYLFSTFKLITRVDAAGITIRFYPLRSKLISFAEIASCEARTYKPLAEYGGWGIKYGPGGRAYNISGDRGAQLVMKDGKRLLIGSQRADELASVIKQFVK